MAIVEKLENQILNTITNLRNTKKQSNEDTIYHVRYIQVHEII